MQSVPNLNHDSAKTFSEICSLPEWIPRFYPEDNEQIMNLTRCYLDLAAKLEAPPLAPALEREMREAAEREFVNVERAWFEPGHFTERLYGRGTEAHIIACSPANVLALLDELERVRAENAELTRDLDLARHGAYRGGPKDGDS